MQCQAAAALVNFLEHFDCVDHPISESRVDSLVDIFVHLICTGKTYTQEQALVCLSTLADRSAGDYFAGYYPRIMPLLIDIMESTQDLDEFLLLRSKAVECASFVGTHLCF